LALNPNIHIRDCRESTAGNLGLAAKILSNQANQRVLLLPAHLGDALKIGSNSRQRGRRANQQRDATQRRSHHSDRTGVFVECGKHAVLVR